MPDQSQASPFDHVYYGSSGGYYRFWLHYYSQSSLSYDTIKAHGGEIKVDSKDGEYTEFTIHIPA